MPKPPNWLDSEAKNEWKRIAGLLHEHGLLTTLDRAALSLYCQAWSDFIKARKLVEDRGEIDFTANGTAIQDPSVGIANKAWERVLKAAREFGLTPSARTGLRVPGPKDAGDAEDEAKEILGL